MAIGKGSPMGCWRMKTVAAMVAVLALVATTQTAAYAATLDPPAGLTATAGDAKVTLAWDAASGSPAVSDYLVQYSADGGTVWTTFTHGASTAVTIVVTPLTNGTAYKFKVYSINSDGIGLPTAAVLATPKTTHTANDPATFSACPTAAIPAGSTVAIPPAGFSDITSTLVDCIKYYDITKGTTATTYSPLDVVSRWQMALFLKRLATVAQVTLGDGSDQGFTDIGGKSSEIQTAINQLKQLEVTTGTIDGTTYDPDSVVTREQMALFIHRLLKKVTVGPGGNTEYVSGTSGAKEIKSNDTDHNFTDLGGLTLVESVTAISSLWNLGVAVGTTGTLYEPQKSMNRSMMATFMANALDHTNVRPAGLLLQADTYRTTATPLLTFSVSHRTDAFVPIVGTYIDTFYFVYSVDTSIDRWNSTGYCADIYATTGIGEIKCKIEATDPVTDSSGNSAFTFVPGNLVETDFWAWTATVGTDYDNDIHANSASKVTVETTS